MNQAAMMKIRKMQKEMMDAQKRIAETVFTGKSGGGMVEIQMTGEHEVKSVKIDPEALESKEDIEMIEDSLVAALMMQLSKLSVKLKNHLVDSLDFQAWEDYSRNGISKSDK